MLKDKVNFSFCFTKKKKIIWLGRNEIWYPSDAKKGGNWISKDGKGWKTVNRRDIMTFPFFLAWLTSSERPGPLIDGDRDANKQKFSSGGGC